MASLTLLTDDLLLDIFLRLAEPADLVRIAAACIPFRRLVADRAFLRRFRSLHPAPLLGLLDHNGFHPALPPHASAPAARAVSLAADFSFSFLPASSTGRGWVVRDVRDGRVLLDRSPEDGGEEPQVFTEIAVCDPLHRRSVLLPPIPVALATAVEHPLRLELDRWCEHFLVPHGADGGDPEDETWFGVICMVQCKAKLVAVAFSSTTGEWRAVASMAWRDLMAGLGVSSRSPAFSGHQNARGCVYWIVIDWRDGLGVSGSPAFYGRQYARGCFYWAMKNWLDKLLVLDARKMEFSIADVPPGCHNQQIAVVEAGEGRVGMFALCDHVAGGAASLQSLHYSVRRDDADGSNSIQWQVEKIIPLDPRSRYCIMGAMERYTLLLRFPEYLSLAGVHASSSAVMEDFECFSMDARTLQLEKVCELDHHIKRAYVYTNFPPSLSPQSI